MTTTMSAARNGLPPVAPGTRLLGEIITWSCSGASIRHLDLVRALRDRVGTSQAAFARLVGASVKLVQAWEQGRRVPALSRSRAVRVPLAGQREGVQVRPVLDLHRAGSGVDIVVDEGELAGQRAAPFRQHGSDLAAARAQRLQRIGQVTLR